MNKKNGGQDEILNQRRAKIRTIGDEIQRGLGVVVGYEDSPRGRSGTRCYVLSKKKGIDSIEVISYQNGNLKIGFSIPAKHSDKVRPRLVSLLQKHGFKISDDIANPRFGGYSLSKFKKIFQLVANANNDELEDDQPRGLGERLFQIYYDPLKIVQRYKFAIENEDQALLNLSRRLLEADDFDAAIAVNRKYRGYDYREHVVPCILIHNKIIDLVREKVDDELIADLITRNLKIAHISREEARKLDFELGLKTSMPEGWSFEDDIFQRLKDARIEVRHAFDGYADQLKIEYLDK